MCSQNPGVSQFSDVPAVDETQGDGGQATYMMSAAGADILANDPCVKMRSWSLEGLAGTEVQPALLPWCLHLARNHAESAAWSAAHAV